MRKLLRLVAIVAGAGLFVAGVSVAIAPQVGHLFSAGSATAEPLDLDPLAERSLVYASDGSLTAVLHAEENRAEVRLENVPHEVIDAVVVTEDEDFYSHEGVNLRATLRALLENVESGAIEQGGSTITQQVVKNALLTPEQDLDRKTREAALAVRLEERMSKEQILTRYLNTVYFGNGAYGVQAAAELYFGVDVSELGWEEASLLAGLIRNPANSDPIRYPEEARARRAVVVRRLVATGHLSEDQAEWINALGLPESRIEYLPPPDNYFVEEVKQELLDDVRLGETATERYNAVFRGGLRIHTTFEPRAQLLAAASRNEVLGGLGGDSVAQFGLPADPATGEPRQGTVAIASVDPSSGAVRALVGGPGFDRFKYNLATQGLRQPGSSFKVYVLMAALENGIVPNDSISGSGPCRFDNPGGYPDPYVARNFGNSGGGGGTITSQTQRSSNCAFLRLGQVVGLDKVVETGRAMGLTTPLDERILSMPLGSMEVTPLEMASAYGVIANDGIRHEPYYIDRVEDRDGNVLFEHRPTGTRALSVQSARLGAEILEKNVQSGTGTRARLSGQPAAGKTGTAQNFEDAWFVGFTPYLSTAVWMGAPVEKIPMRSVGGRSVTGGSYPAMIWGGFMNPYHEPLEPRDFASPERTRGGQYLRVDRAVDFGSPAPRRATTSIVIDNGPTTSIGRGGPTTSVKPGTSVTTSPPTTTATTTPPTTGGDTGGGDD